MLKFCPYCGAKILDADIKFCMDCGKSLAKFIEASSNDEITETKSSTKSTRATQTKSLRSKSSPNNQAIEMELIKCREAAEEGYQLASEKYKEIQKTLVEESRRIASANAEQNQVDRIQNTELIKEQESELYQLGKYMDDIGEDLRNLHERQKDFSIIVYGRTMAGKSTLMEILTRGNGQSIGRGAQRTTRDIRNYYWNGLKITDVPGICAFDGAEDERVAMEAAKSADLIIFLITNDAPQADEAACLAQLKSLGKPVLGIINVKVTFNLDSSDWDMDLEDLEEKLADTSTINSIVKQFKAFDKSHNQDWSDIKFVSTHLLSAYQAHPCRGNNAQVYAASQFAQVEDFILDKVRRDGRFLRIKTFADAVAVPMCDIVLKVYEHSANALLESDIWLEKRAQLTEWRKEFLARSKKKLDGLYEELSGKLDKAIYNFAENHYEDEKVNENWPRAFQSLGFDKEYQNLLTELANECARKRKELSDELTQELKFSFSGRANTNIELEGTTAWGEYGAAIIGGVGGIGGFVAARLLGVAFPPLGIALGILSFVGWIFSDSKAEKIRKAKAKLREDLKPPSFEMLDKMHSQIIDIFNKEILNKGVDEFWDMLASYQFMLARLGKSQSDTAEKLSNEYRHLNALLLNEAIKYANAGSFSNADMPMRVPGEQMVLLAEQYNLNNEALTALLGEKFVTLTPKKEFLDTVKMLLGCDFSVDGYRLEFDTDEKKGDETFAIIPDVEINKRKFQLAQQITGVPIVAR